MMEFKPLVSIIIPVYNAAKTLNITLQSLLSQNYDNIELIFINDCSSDDSLEILDEFRNLNSNRFKISIISHSTNSGVAVARNTGLDVASGDYIYYVDADDYIVESAILRLVEKAQKENLDIVGCQWFLSFKSNSRKMSQPNFSSNFQAIDLMFLGKMRWNLWLFLVKRDLYENNHIRFIPRMNMGEDAMVMVKLFFYAQKVGLLDDYLYHYNQNTESSLTKTYSEINYQEVTSNVQEIESFINSNSKDEVLRDSINFLKLNIKLPLLVSNNRKNYERWNTWFVEANDYIFKNKSSSYRTKFLEYAAKKKMYFFLDAYYSIVIKFVYGIIYK